MSVRLLLIRHARPDLQSRDFRTTVRGRQWDPPLDGRGQEQAEALTARLVLMDRPAAVVVSPFERCRQTIEPFLRSAAIDAVVQEELGEVFIGDWEGLAFEEILSGNEELAQRFRDQDAMFSLAPRGESGAQLRARVIPAVERIIEPIGDGVVVVVTHGGVINAYLGDILGIGHDMFFLPDHASINSVVVEGVRREVRFLNDVRHLTDPAVFAPPAGVADHARPKQGSGRIEKEEEGPGSPGPS